MFMPLITLVPVRFFGLRLHLAFLLAADSWCVGGDFNMLEMAGDRRGDISTSIHGAELASWERFCLSIRLEDAWFHPCFARS